MSLSTRVSVLRIFLFAILGTAAAVAHAATPDTGATAEAIMGHVKSQAAAEHKNILLSFSASWCVNCHLFDTFMADPAIRPIMDKAFVFADIITGERPGDKHHANTPGGLELEASLAGKGAGYPYLVMTDADGKLITNSIRPANLPNSGNIGYPEAPYEIDWFMQMLQKAAPSLTTQDTTTIRKWLTARSHIH